MAVVLRRLRNEFPPLRGGFECIRNDQGEYEVHVIYKGKQCKVILDDHYPFRPPKDIVYDNVYLNRHTKKINGRCIGCSGLLCQSLWSPAFRITHILDHYLELFWYQDRAFLIYCLIYQYNIPLELLDNILKYIVI